MFVFYVCILCIICTVFLMYYSAVLSGLVAQTVKNLPAMQEIWVWEDPWRREWLFTPVFLDFPGGSDGKEFACQCRRCRRSGFNPWVRKIPWSRKWQPIPVFLPGESHGQRRLPGYSPWGCKESDMTEATHTNYTNMQILLTSSSQIG